MHRRRALQASFVVPMQGTNFNATVQIEWPDPAPPNLGEAGAETMIQDVSFYRR